MLKRIAFAAALLAGMTYRCGAESLKVLVGGVEHRTILVIELDRTSGCPPPMSPCNLHIAGHVVRVVNDAGHRVEILGGFEADVTQVPFGMVREADWSRTHAEAGRRYMIGAAPGQTLTAMVQGPLWVVPITDDEDFVGDLELMLASVRLPLADQASAVAAALTNSTTPRSWQLAQYAVALLAEAPSRDTVALSQAIEDEGGHALSSGGKNTLLVALWSELRDQQVPADNMLRLLVKLVARYYVDSPRDLGAGQSDLRLQIVRNELPWILSSERAKGMLRSELQPALAEQFRQRALKDKDAVDVRFSPADREKMKRLAEFIGEPRR